MRTRATSEKSELDRLAELVRHRNQARNEADRAKQFLDAKPGTTRFVPADSRNSTYKAACGVLDRAERRLRHFVLRQMARLEVEGGRVAAQLPFS
jgi:hypothetical protein